MSVNKNSSISTVPPPNDPPPKPPPPTPLPPTQPEGIRRRGVPETTSKLAREINEQDITEIKEMLTVLSIKCQISELQKIDAY